jgi:hypothetical protein
MNVYRMYVYMCVCMYVCGVRVCVCVHAWERGGPLYEEFTV